MNPITEDELGWLEFMQASIAKDLAEARARYAQEYAAAESGPDQQEDCSDLG